VIPLSRAIPECIRSGLQQCAIQIDVYFTSVYFKWGSGPAMDTEICGSEVLDLEKFSWLNTVLNLCLLLDTVSHPSKYRALVLIVPSLQFVYNL